MTDAYRRACAALDIPRIETERLILRGFRIEDAADLARIHGDAEVVRFLGGTRDASLTGAFDKIAAYLGHWSVRGCGKWAVEDKATGRVVGRSGYNDYPFGWPGLELGWTFARDHWGKGYAAEAARSALAWGFTVLRADRIVSMIHPDNTASQAVARKLGETPWRAHDHEGSTHVLWSMTRTAWLSRAGAA